MLARYDAETIEQTKLEMVRNFAKNGVSIEIIAKSANISIDEVEEILKNDAK